MKSSETISPDLTLNTALVSTEEHSAGEMLDFGTSTQDASPTPTSQPEPASVTTMLEAALQYADQGIPVFPCWAEGPRTKRPMTPNGFQNATTDKAQIIEWWTASPNALIGMPTGAVSGLVVLDVDMDLANGKDGETSLANLLKQYGHILPVTKIAGTQRGGRHIYFRHPGVKIPSRTNWLGDALDVRGDGGYVILPPSCTQSGAYTWLEVADAAPLPSWLRALMVGEKIRKDPGDSAPTQVAPQPSQTPSDEVMQICSALKFIPASDRTVWLKVGFGLMAHFGESGWQIFDEWSQSAPEAYDPERNLAQWRSFKPDGGIGIGTVFKLAKEHGWIPARAGNTATRKEDSKDRILTLRSPDELLAMTFDDSDIILGDRILAKGQPLVIAAQGGTGKSRLAIQMIGAIVTGQRWLAFNTGGHDLHWLVLQTENSNRRLQQDLGRIKQWLGDKWQKFADQVVFHTLENDDDGFVSLESPENQMAIQKAIESRNFGGVVIDPLNDFVAGDPNKDADMRNTLQILSRLCRRGNPARAIVVLHHSLTGKAGAARAIGFDRSSFARNSKALHGWTRGQINLVAVDADNNARLIVACGKCSNGPEFPTFGVAMNPETMIYECDPTIDIQSWASDMGAKSDGPDLSPGIVAGVVGELAKVTGAPKKATIVKALRDETGCSISGAYNAILRAERATKIRFTKATKTYATP